MSMITVSEALNLARTLLSEQPRRWRHVQGVAARAEELRPAMLAEDAELLVTAAWLHDIGYSPSLVHSGMHQYDGARYLEAGGYPIRLVGLVAHHSAAIEEAKASGRPELEQAMLAYPQERSPVADALWTADLTTDPDGNPTTYAARIAEVLQRYDRASVVGQAVTNGAQATEAAVNRTLARMSGR